MTSKNRDETKQFVRQFTVIIIIVIFNEDANVTKWFTEGSSEEY